MANMFLSGKIAWAKLFEPDEYNGEKRWKINFYPDAKSWDIIKGAGIKRREKSNDMGRYINLDRPTVRDFPKTGRTELDPPRVLDADGNDWDPKVLIGNGSEVTVQIDVYDSKFGKGSRLEGVRIDKLVEYEGGGDLATVNVREPETYEIPGG